MLPRVSLLTGPLLRCGPSRRARREQRWRHRRRPLSRHPPNAPSFPARGRRGGARLSGRPASSAPFMAHERPANLLARTALPARHFRGAALSAPTRCLRAARCNRSPSCCVPRSANFSCTKERLMAPSSYPGSTTQQTKEKAVEQFDKMTERATEQFKAVADQAESAANRTMEQARQMGDGVQRVAGTFKEAVDRSVKDQPMATLAMAAVVGFVLGALWE